MAGEKLLRKDRDFVLLAAGTTVNDIGDWLLELALPVFIFVETGSGASTAAFFIVRLLAGLLFGPAAGALVDRSDLRLTLVATNVLQIVALFPLLAASSERIWPIYLAVVLQALVRAVNNPAGFALVPNLVDEEQVVAANSVLSAAGSLARLIGAAAGGIAIGIGGLATVVIVDGATFAFGAAAAWLMRPVQRRSGGEDQPETPDKSGVVAGLREIRHNSPLVSVIGVHGIAMFVFGGFPILFIVFVTTELGGGEAEVGIIRATSAIGGLVGAAILGRIGSRYAPPVLMSIGYVAFGLAAFAFVNASVVTAAAWVSAAFYASTGVPNVISQVGMKSTSQALCPPAFLGRLGGILAAVGAVSRGLGAALVGVFLEVFAARPLLNIQVVLLFACAVISVLFVARPLERKTVH